MPLEDTIETFTHYIKELVAMNIAYIQLCRYDAWGDPEFDGKQSAL